MLPSLAIKGMQNRTIKEYHYELTQKAKNDSEIPGVGEMWSRGHFPSPWDIKWCKDLGKLSLKIFIPYDSEHLFWAPAMKNVRTGAPGRMHKQ